MQKNVFGVTVVKTAEGVEEKKDRAVRFERAGALELAFRATDGMNRELTMNATHTMLQIVGTAFDTADSTRVLVHVDLVPTLTEIEPGKPAAPKPEAAKPASGMKSLDTPEAIREADAAIEAEGQSEEIKAADEAGDEDETAPDVETHGHSGETLDAAISEQQERDGGRKARRNRKNRSKATA